MIDLELQRGPFCWGRPVNVKQITALHNGNTNLINKTIGIIFKHLFNNYVKITPHMLTHRDDAVKHMTFDVNAPIDTILNNVEELEDIATTDLNIYTNQNYINLAYKIIKKLNNSR